MAPENKNTNTAQEGCLNSRNSPKANEAPPSYDSVLLAQDQDRFLLAMNEGGICESSPSDDVLLESERIRNFMLFILSADYGLKTRRHLSTEDREHFTNIYHLIRTLRRDLIAKNMTLEKRVDFGTIFTPFVIKPCIALGLPYALLIKACERFISGMSWNGTYNGSIRRIGLSQGLEEVAQKLYLDKTVVIPQLVALSEHALREDILRHLQAVSNWWFESISGFETWTGPNGLLNSNSRLVCSGKVVYQLNQRGVQQAAALKSSASREPRSLVNHVGLFGIIKGIASRVTK